MRVNEVLAVCLFSYRNLATEHETLMQKYLHLLQIVETEKTVAKQLRQQIEDGEIEIERLKLEVTCNLMVVSSVCVHVLFYFIVNSEKGERSDRTERNEMARTKSTKCSRGGKKVSTQCKKNNTTNWELLCFAACRTPRRL